MILGTYKRLGRFQVHIEIINQGDKAQLKALFSKLIITRAEMVLHTGCIDYMAICDDFDPVQQGQVIPFYKWEYNSGVWKAVKSDEQYNILDKN